VPYRFPSLALLLGRLLDALDIDEVDVLGISWGGGQAQQFAFQNPAAAGVSSWSAPAQGG
jgi:pimeloyl-ACP methyl ester carboxylesterase